MATKDDIITLPNKHLRQRSTRVGLITDDIRKLISKMEEATLDWEDSRSHEVGVALAAVQIDELLRIVVIRSNFDDKNDRTFRTFINPEIVKYEGEIQDDYEGCLSIQDIYGKVKRHTRVRIKAKDIAGKEFRLTVDGFVARIFQHEIDHLNGIVFVDHIKDNKDAFYRLDKDGRLEELNYENDIQNNSILW